MKKNRYTEEQVTGILKQSEAGVKTPDLCREHGISAATFVRLEVEVRRHGRQRGAAAEGDGGREPPSEAAGSGAESALRSAEGRYPKKLLELAGLRGSGVRVSRVPVSERTACKLLNVERSSSRYEPGPIGTWSCAANW